MQSDPRSPDEYPSLVFGLIGPLGTDLDLLTKVLQDEVSKVGYGSELIQISELMKNIAPFTQINEKKEDIRIRRLMNAGTALREATERGDVVAYLAMKKMMAPERKGRNRKAKTKSVCYIVRSLKHPDEVEAFRDIYGDSFFAISAYAPRHQRVEKLARRIASSHGDADWQKHLPAAESLILRDEDEEGSEFGQDVSKAFPEADFFVDVTSKRELSQEVERFIEIIFGHPFHTPHPHEMGMFQAFAASLRSADLSRQVGAAILTSDAEVITLGCNEVPKAGGGQYWPGERDGRDFQRGYDSAAHYKREIIKQVIERFSNVVPGISAALTPRFLDGDLKHIFAGTQIANLLEFGRVVHAEMAALSEAARRGVSVDRAILYCTTFPCHMCARHIIAAGVRKVVFIEPYPKSVSHELYSDSAEFDQGRSPMKREGDRPTRVSFESFVGISPKRFLGLFRKRIRKEKNGDALSWRKNGAHPSVRVREKAIRERISSSIIFAEDVISQKSEKISEYFAKLEEKHVDK